jgi:hypothetical protein
LLVDVGLQNAFSAVDKSVSWLPGIVFGSIALLFGENNVSKQYELE